MRILQQLALAGIAVAGMVALPPQQAAAQNVALELSLVMDVSGSIDNNEYNLQRLGYSNAFLNPAIQNAIMSFAPSGGIAVNVIQFSTNAVESVGWTQLNSVASINSFAATLATLTRLSSGLTDVEDGMRVAIDSIQNNSFNGTRKVIDVSGDGTQNEEPSCTVTAPLFADPCAAVRTQRDLALSLGIKVNGLAIEGDFGVDGVTNWYNANVKTSDGFVVTATNFNTFGNAVADKIGREITDVPEPATMAILGVGLLGLGIARRRRNAA